MELRHLRYFLAVAEQRNFGRAADQLFVGQSTLSEQIRALEREVGGPLFARTSRRVELTEAGRLLVPEARRAIEQADRALRVATASTAGELGSVRVGFAGVAALSGLLADDLRAFRAARPQVEVEVVEADPPTLVEALRSGAIDIAYAPDLRANDDIDVRRRQSVPFSIGMSAEHPLAAAETVRVADLREEMLIVFTIEDESAALRRLQRTIGTDSMREATSTLSVLTLAAAGAGLALVPSAAGCVALPGLVYRPLMDARDIIITTARRRDETAGPVLALFALDDERT